MRTFSSPREIFREAREAIEVSDLIGLLISFVIFSLWVISLIAALMISISDTAWYWLIFAVLVRSYLHTGLFILGHDSMHGNLIPHNRRLNNIIGGFAVGVYAFLPYTHCYVNHHNHHRYPSQSGDPDFHGRISHPVFWYCKFIREYFPLRSLITFLVNMSLIFWGLTLILNVPFTNLILFWLVPLVLSSLQLFFFGTYLPHRQVCENSNFSPRLKSNFSSVLWSFVSCYNFGHYHWEHHEYPKTPWYLLPNIHSQGDIL